MKHKLRNKKIKKETFEEKEFLNTEVESEVRLQHVRERVSESESTLAVEL